MISLWLEAGAAAWFGIAEHDSALVATVVARSRDQAMRNILGCLPADAPHRLETEASDFARKTVAMLEALERGDEEGKRFELSPLYVVEPLRAVLLAAAAIPLGYASTYGYIAAIAGTEARVVGRIMATNPLYPIVPCHRVVGSDLALVGYGGGSDDASLRDKLGRLKAEARGRGGELRIQEAGGLRVLPVEWVIAKAGRDGKLAARQLDLW